MNIAIYQKKHVKLKMGNKDYYLPADFIKAPKFDAHIHYHFFGDVFVRLAKKANIRFLTINTNLGFLTINTQFKIAQFVHQQHPQVFDFIGTFDASSFSSKTFTEDTVEQIQNCMTAGARGIKIWKNIGMILKNEAGQYLMADDPVFDPIYAFLEKEKIPLLAHLGEPRVCWLPPELSTQYFRDNPIYHMYLHPEAPSYEQHLLARDHILERYPELIFVGAHWGSMEWNLEEVAKRFNRFPNFYVDLSGRFEYILKHTVQNRNMVIDFFETYQNRILYGSDCSMSPSKSIEWKKLIYKYFPHAYMSWHSQRYLHLLKKEWLFLATNQLVKKEKDNQSEAPNHVAGLKLSKKIVDRVFYENACCVYHNPKLKF